MNYEKKYRREGKSVSVIRHGWDYLISKTTRFKKEKGSFQGQPRTNLKCNEELLPNWEYPMLSGRIDRSPC